jgi:DNA-binding beta-propeller fold protein YncE
VGKYDTASGAAISPSFITGLSEPIGLAVLGNTLFVADVGIGTVGKYDAKTGAAISPSFITGLIGPRGLAVKSAK